MATIAGVRQILIANASSITAHDLSDGHILWQIPWPVGMPTVSQVVALSGDRVFMSKGYAVGCGLWQIRRDKTANPLGQAGKWSADEIWRKQPLMQTKFTNVVIRDGYAYGLSDGFLECLAWTRAESAGPRVAIAKRNMATDRFCWSATCSWCNPRRERSRWSSLLQSGSTRSLAFQLWLAAPGIIRSLWAIFPRAHYDREAACYELPLRSK